MSSLFILSYMSFTNRVYEVTKKIPRGKVSTYKDIALALNCKAYRAVGSALKKNPFAPFPLRRFPKFDEKGPCAPPCCLNTLHESRVCPFL